MTDYKIIDELDISSITEQKTIVTLLSKFFQKNFKEIFINNERLRVILGDSDFYDNNATVDVGFKLTWIQNVADEVDISRCYIEVCSTNPKLNEEIIHLSRSKNVDQQLRGNVMVGEYSQIREKTTGYRYSSQIPTKINLENLNEKETYWLTKSKTFCMYPWIHLNASPDGEAMPCCSWEYNERMGSTKDYTIKELWNSDKWRELRRNMINDVTHKGCERCYTEERSGFFSNRQSANKHHGHHIDKVSNTLEDGTAQKFEMTYWDIRFSNLCNLSCRSCGHIFSSSWYQDQKALAGPEWGKKNKALFWAGRHEVDMLEQLMEHIDYVEQIYFAGGEPLMMKEHYHILEELEKRKKFNVRLVYNTNFTKTKLKDRYVFDYWKKFDNVSIGASLDAMGPHAEYIRKGTVWSDVEENRRRMQEICPNVDFYISPTLSIQNAWHLPDFHRDWVERGFIKPQDLHVNLLQDPDFLRVDIAPLEFKKKLVEKYEKHLEWLMPQDSLQRATQGFKSAINFINDQDNTDLIPKFWQRMSKLDEIRNEKLLQVIPELNALT